MNVGTTNCSSRLEQKRSLRSPASRAVRSYESDLVLLPQFSGLLRSRRGVSLSEAASSRIVLPRAARRAGSGAAGGPGRWRSRLVELSVSSSRLKPPHRDRAPARRGSRRSPAPPPRLDRIGRRRRRAIEVRGGSETCVALSPISRREPPTMATLRLPFAFPGRASARDRPRSRPGESVCSLASLN